MVFGTLLYASIQPIITVVFLCTTGALCARLELLNLDGRKSLSGLAFLIFYPALAFTKLASSITAQRLIHWWPLILNMTLSVGLGGLLGVAQNALLQPEAKFRPHVILTTALGNTGNLPLVIVASMASTSSGVVLRGVVPLEAGDLAIAYVMVGSLVAMIVQVTIGFHMLRPIPPPAAPQGKLAGLGDDGDNANEVVLSVSDAANPQHSKCLVAPSLDAAHNSHGVQPLALPCITCPGALADQLAAPQGHVFRPELCGPLPAAHPDHHRNAAAVTSSDCGPATWSAPTCPAASGASMACIADVGASLSSVPAASPADGPHLCLLPRRLREPAVGCGASTAASSYADLVAAAGVEDCGVDTNPPAADTQPLLQLDSASACKLPPAADTTLHEGSELSWMHSSAALAAGKARSSSGWRRRGGRALRQGRRAAAAVAPCLSPPMVAVLLAMLVGTVRPLQALLFGGSAPLAPITECLNMLSDCLIPSMMLVLGATLCKGPGGGQVPLSTIVSISVVRLVVIPALGTFLVVAAYRMGLFYAPDQVMLLVMLIQNCAPTAISVQTMCMVHGNGYQEVATILFWQYVLSIFTVPAFLVLFLWLIDLVYTGPT